MKQGKEIYDNIVIPDELSERVQQAIASVDRERAGIKGKKQKKNKVLIHLVKGAGSLAAVLVVCLTIGVNTSQVFAEEMAGIPVLGMLARVLTVRSYEATEGDVNIKVEVPEITIDSSAVDDTVGKETIVDLNANKDFVMDINKEITAIVEEHLAKSKLDMEEYKKAFFETGGTEEEWADRTMDVDVDYVVKYQSGPYLSLVLTTSEDWVSAYSQSTYYNLDLENNKELTLKDLMGEDYIAIANEEILKQIEERMAADENMMYFGFGSDDMQEAKFTSIDENTSFYINEAGNPVICFDKYEISPGYMGVQEFEIVK